jgi:hypothetical protein
MTRVQHIRRLTAVLAGVARIPTRTDDGLRGSPLGAPFRRVLLF